MKKIIFSSLLIFALPLGVFGFFGKNIEESVTLASGQIVAGDFIRFGNVIDVSGNVDGDVIAFGSYVNVSGNISGDIIALASDIKISGDVKGNVRVAGGSVEISGKVGKNVNVFSGTAVFTKESILSGEVYVAGGVIQPKGTIEKSLFARGDQLILSGTVLGNAFVRTEGENRIIVEEGAKIDGDLNYVTPEESQLEMREGATVSGKVAHQLIAPKEVGKKALQSIYVFGRILYLFGLLVIGLVFVTLVPKLMHKISDDMQMRPGKNFIRGFITLIVTPVIIVVLLFTIIGIPLGLLLIPIYIITLYVCKVFACIALGLYITKKIRAQGKEQKNLFPAMIIGTIVFVLLISIPYFGWVVSLFATIWALGAVVEIKREEIARWK